MPKKYTIEAVKEIFRNSGCLLLEDEYINNRTNMKYICVCGNQSEIRLDDFLHGKRCRKCKNKKIGNSKRKTIDEVRKVFEKYGCVLLSTIYVNAKSPLDYICVCGNPSITTYDVMKRGCLCENCGIEKRSKSRRIPYIKVKECFESKSCVLLTSENDYIGITSVVKYLCSCGEQAEVVADVFYNGSQEGCMKCAPKRRAEFCQEKYGVDNPMQVPEIKEKSLKTAYENGTIPTSSQQFYIHSIIGGELNYPVGKSPLDIAFPDKKIYVEYNGGLHDGRVKFGVKTEEEFQNYEIRRRYALFNRGWKEIRIVSSKDRLPKEDGIKEMIDFAINYLQDHHWIEFNLNDNKVKSSQFDKEYDFGKTFIFYKRLHSHLIEENYAKNKIKVII
jgi:hypothetical protein